MPFPSLHIVGSLASKLPSIMHIYIYIYIYMYIYIYTYIIMSILDKLLMTGQICDFVLLLQQLIDDELTGLGSSGHANDFGGHLTMQKKQII